MNHSNVIADGKQDNIREFETMKCLHNQSFSKWTYPSKADKSEIRKFLNFLEMLPRHKNVLIIGSNPELRDIGFITRKNITCCDYNKHTMELMKNNMKYKKFVNNSEHLIECDVLNMSKNEILSKQKYDLILSIDGHLNALPFDKWDTFLNEISDRLQSNGFFILKIMNKPKESYLNKLVLLSPEQICDDWLHSKFKNDIGCLFMSLLMYLYDQSNNTVNWRDVINLVSDRCEKYAWEWTEEQKKEFFEKFGDFKENDYLFYCRGEDIVKSLLSEEMFYFQQICYGNDDEEKYKFTPIYVLGKQSSRTGGSPKVWGYGEPRKR